MATASRKRTAPAVRHLDDCPQDRVETYPVSTPAGPQTITRCIDCGEATVTPDNIEIKEA